MKFNSILLLTFVLLSALVLVTCQDDAKGRANPLLRRAGPRTGAKTSTTTAAPAEEEAPAEEDYDQTEGEEGAEKDGDEAAEPAPVSTEAPKKIGPIIRPFRSNDDLLNALKRRQQNVKPGVYKPLVKAAPGAAATGDAEENQEAPAKSSSGGRGEGSGKKPSRFNLRSARS